MAKTALKREVVVKKVDDGSHGHVCPHCTKIHRHVDPKCQYIGLAYFSCPECLKLGGDPFAGKVDYIDDLIEVAPDFEEAVKAVNPGDSLDTFNAAERG